MYFTPDILISLISGRNYFLRSFDLQKVNWDSRLMLIIHWKLPKTDDVYHVPNND
jgi:hypothetical protein